MQGIELLRKRRSIREYKGQPIPDNLLQDFVDSARFAPTARNVQPWEFVIITQKDTLKKISELAENGRFIAQAAACIAVFCHDTKYYLEDGCAATLNIMLAATAFGVGSCWVAGDKKPYCAEVSRLLNAGADLKLVSLISLGWPLSYSELKETEKKPLEKLIHRNKF